AQLTTKIPPVLLLCRDDEIVHEAGILDYRWSTPTKLSLTGSAYIRGLALEENDHETYLELINIDSGETRTIATDRIVLSDIDRRSNDKNVSYARAGFTVEFDTTGLPGLTSLSEGLVATWRVRVVTEASGITVGSDFAWRDRTGAAAWLDDQGLHNGARLVAKFSRTEGLQLSLEIPRFVIVDLQVSGRDLIYQVRSRSNEIATRLSARCSKTGQKASGLLEAFDGEIATYRMSLPTVPSQAKVKGEWEWTIVAESPSRPATPLAWFGTEAELEAAVDPAFALTARLSGFGYVRILERRWRIVVSECNVSDDGRFLTVEGSCDIDANKAPRIVLANSRGSIEAVKSELVVTSNPHAHRISTSFDLQTDSWGLKRLARESGAESLRYVPVGVESVDGQ